MLLRLFLLMFSSINVGEAIAERASTVAEVKMSYCFQKREDFLLSLGGGGVYLNSPDMPCSGMERGVLVLTRLWLGSWLCRHNSHRMQDGHTLTGTNKKQQHGRVAKLKHIQDTAYVLYYNAF